MDKLIFVLQLILANWQRVLVGGVILTSTIIFIIGCLKKAKVYNAIKNEGLRKTVLSISSIILTFPAVAVHFALDGINFDYYWYGCVGLACANIITYYLYETSHLREGIDWIGENTVFKFFGVLADAFAKKKSNKETKVALVSVTTSLQETVREEVVKSIKANTKEDEDLKNL